MRRLLAAAATAAAITLPTLPSYAAVIDIQGIVGSWSDADVAVTYADNGTATPTVRWGVANTAAGRSGYNFTSAGSASVTVPPSPSASFVLGTFNHVNQPINPPWLSSVALTVTAEIVIDGASQGNRNFVFNFVHEETPNNPAGGQCTYGGANGQGINLNGCADRVTVTYNNSSETFQIGDRLYTLNIAGFQIGGDFATQFLTREQQNNDADLLANITLRLDDVTVPTPMSLALFASGLVGLAAVGRRRKA